MKTAFAFANLVGTVYKGGNVAFTPDGSTLVSPVGNRVTLFDLAAHASFTMPTENSRDVAHCALSPDGALLLTVDATGRALLASVARRAPLAHVSFGQRVHSVAWSPDGRLLAVGLFRTLEVWRPPALAADVGGFAPFALVARLVGHHDDVTHVEWSPDSRFVATASRDGTTKVYAAAPGVRAAPVTLSAHTDRPVAAFFASDDDGAYALYTVARDSRIVRWQWLVRKKEDDAEEDEDDGEDDGEREFSRKRGRWSVDSKTTLGSPGQKVRCCAYHRKTGLLAVGFNRGVFALYQAPELVRLQTLSISRHAISSVAINSSGEWLAFASAKLGQLLVWEWRSETYILKQQGHAHDMGAVAYSPNGRLVATGGDDGKVKIWDTSSWFCFVTFADHTAPVSAIAFAPNGLSVVSASLDGTVRAYDLIRYRNYRTLTPPTPTQLSCLALDNSGEIVAAGAVDAFDVFVWSMQTGKLLDVLSGHEGPVSALAFCPTSQVLATASWDRTVRLWDAFEGRAHREALSHNGDVLALAWKPDGREVCSSALDGTLSFWDAEQGTLLGTIEGAADAAGGRRVDDTRTSKTNPRSRYFTSLCYSPDGSCVLAASGETRYVCLYEISRKLLLRRFSTTRNLSLDGVLDTLSSARMTEAGPVDLLPGARDDSDASDASDAEARVLPGVKRGERGQRHVRKVVATRAICFGPDGRSWAAATAEGLLVYSLDARLQQQGDMAFDPFELDEECTPEAVAECTRRGEHLKALVMAFRLNEAGVVERAFDAVPSDQIRAVCQQMPAPHVRRLLEAITSAAEHSPKLERTLLWASEALSAHAELARSPRMQAALVPAIRALYKQLIRHRDALTTRCSENRYTLEFLCTAASLQP